MLVQDNKFYQGFTSLITSAAVELMRQGDNTSEIIERVGCGSDAAFVRAFKRKFGETPARFRRNADLNREFIEGEIVETLSDR